jgi:hypothetical protein
MLSQPSEPPAELVADIGARLGRICQSYPTDEFESLVRQIAAVRAKYDALRAQAFIEAARALAADRLAAERSPDDLHAAPSPT